VLIAQISDTHIKPEGSLAYGRVDTSAFLARAVDHILHLDPRPDMVLGTGDLVDGGLLVEYAHLRHLLSPLPMPVYLIPGNHDDREALREVFADSP
jgi:3',5'-cyclic AMP phosphodiesterase CpdA